METHARNVRRRLRQSASTMIIAAACFELMGAAGAQTVLTTGNTPYLLDQTTDKYVTIASGTDALLVSQYSLWEVYPATSYPGLSIASLNALDSTTGAPIINIDEGASLRVTGGQTQGWGAWWRLTNMINSSGTVIIEGCGDGTVHFNGTTNLLGTLKLLDGAALDLGEAWTTSSVTFGAHSNIEMGANSYIYLRMPGNWTSALGGIMTSTDATAKFELVQGTLVMNGQNTAAAPYLGSIVLDPGAVFMVGDAAHSSAIFGDPNHPDGSAMTINVTRTNGTAASLRGYGTVIATVNNASGIVRPGGTSGTLGTLTVSKYVQGSTGTLQVEISPEGASKLNVLGAATIGGSLMVTIDKGSYGNSIFPILSASSITGSFTSVSTNGNTAGAIVGLSITNTGYSIVTEKATSAQSTGHMVQANRTNIYDFNHALFDRIDMGLPQAGAVKAREGGELSVWMAPFGQIESVGRGGLGYSTTTGGLEAGAEYKLPWHDAVMGIAGSYANQTMDVRGEDSNASSNTYDVAAYGGASVQNARIDGTVFYNVYTGAIHRNLVGADTAKSAPKGWAWGGSLQVSTSFINDIVSPYIRGIFARVHQDAATETGGGALALKYDSIDKNTFMGDVGVRLHLIRPQEGRRLEASLLVAIEHDFTKGGELVVGQFATLTGSDFTYSWKGNDKNAVLVGMDVSGPVANGVEVFGRVNGRFTNYSRAGEISVGGRYRF
jgi:uncharacterized protein with beta-barrel porin domain